MKGPNTFRPVFFYKAMNTLQEDHAVMTKSPPKSATFYEQRLRFHSVICGRTLTPCKMDKGLVRSNKMTYRITTKI